MVSAVAIGSLNGRDVVVASGGDPQVQVWDEHGETVEDFLVEHDHPVNAVAVGSLGGHGVIVAGRGDGTVLILDEHGQSTRRPIDGHRDSVYAVAVGSLGGRDVIVSAGADGTVRIWDQLGEPFGLPLSGHQDIVNAVAIGSLLGHDVVVSGGVDGAVRIWEFATGITTTLPTLSSVRSVAIGQGRAVYAAAFTLIAWKWPLSREEALTTRLFTAWGSPREVDKREGFVAEQGVAAADEVQVVSRGRHYTNDPQV